MHGLHQRNTSACCITIHWRISGLSLPVTICVLSACPWMQNCMHHFISLSLKGLSQHWIHESIYTLRIYAFVYFLYVTLCFCFITLTREWRKEQEHHLTGTGHTFVWQPAASIFSCHASHPLLNARWQHPCPWLFCFLLSLSSLHRPSCCSVV